MELVERAWRVTLPRAAADGRSFHEAGGDSLAFLNLVFLIEEAAGLRVPLDRCDRSMTAEDLARLIDDLNADGGYAPASDATIFLAPGAGGDSPMLAEFRAACGTDLNFITLEYPDWREMVLEEIDAAGLVRRIVDQISRVSPAGPIRLAGFSVGGNIAHEAARRLAEEGRRVEFLGLMDSHAKTAPRRPLFRTQVFVRPRRFESSDPRRGAAGWLARVLVRQRMRSPGRQILRALAKEGLARLPASFAHIFRRRLNMEMHRHVIRELMTLSETPRMAGTRIILYRSEESGGSGREDLGWRAVCPNLEVERVGGSHMDMLRPPHLGHMVRSFVSAARPRLV